jgi:threonyl-tRNA synthetase
VGKMKKEKYEESELYRIRHSAAHVMAQAVMEMFPGEAKIAIGPPIEDGFYYDFDLPRPLTPEDLEAIEKRMREIISEDHVYEKHVISSKEAKKLFADQPYKIELIEGLEEGGYDEYGEPVDEPPEISTYTQDSFTDLCRGPHVKDTNEINPDAVKLLNVAGAYWRGDENRPMLQRIYGTAWETSEELEEYLWKLEEARKRDHRRLGRELDLFGVSEDVGPKVAWYVNWLRIIAVLNTRRADTNLSIRLISAKPNCGRQVVILRGLRRICLHRSRSKGRNIISSQ